MKVIGLTEKEFEEILLKNEVIEWGFDHNKLEQGEPVHDMDVGDRIV